MDQAISMGMDWMPYDKKMLPTEAQEQATLMSWAQMQSFRYPELRLLFHIPNGGGRRKAEAGRFKAEGVKPGVPDLLLPAARGKYHGLFIEMKRMAGAGGKVSSAQKKWIADLREQGYAAEVCFGWKQAAEVITSYLDMEEKENSDGAQRSGSGSERTSIGASELSRTRGSKTMRRL